MRRMAWLVILGLLCISHSSFVRAEVYAFEEITVGTTSIGLTASNLTTTSAVDRTVKVQCYIETAQIRYRLDGTAPTSGVGEILNDNDRICKEALVHGHRHYRQ